MFFSKKPYQVFLEFGGYDQSDILIRKSKAKVCITMTRIPDHLGSNCEMEVLN
jgi:hypothetical protein